MIILRDKLYLEQREYGIRDEIARHGGKENVWSINW